MKQLKKNIVSGTLVHGLNILIGLLSYPVYIHFLGFEQFSTWILISSIIVLAQMGDLGIGKAIINYIAASWKEKDFKKIISYLNSGLLFIVLLTLVISGSILLFLNSIIDLLGVPEIYKDDVGNVIPLMLLSILIILMNETVKSLFTGTNRLDLSNLIHLFTNILKFLLTTVLLISSPNLYSMVYALLLANILTSLSLIFIVVKRYPFYYLSLKLIKLERLKELISFGLSFLGVQIVSISLYPLIKILISRSFGINYVGYYELSMKVAFSLRSIFEKGLFAFFPEFSKSANQFTKSRYSKLKLRIRVNRISKKILLWGGSGILFFALFSEPIINLWLQDSYRWEVVGGFLLLVPLVIVGLFALPMVYGLMAVRRTKFIFFESLIRGVLTLILVYFCTIFNTNYYSIILSISIAAILSNLFIVYKFRLVFQ